MPFSAERKCAFVHIPKTGGSSIVHALSEAGIRTAFSGSGLWEVLQERDDVAALVARLRRSFGITELGTFPQQHLPAAMLCTLVGAEQWAQAFSFAFVRNPWDLMVSSYFYFKAHVREMAGSGRDADRADMAQRCDTFERFVHFYPAMRSDCVEMLAGDGEECMVEFVGRYEHLERDFRLVCRRLHIEASLPHLRASEHAPYRDYYNMATRDAVARHFARDIDRYGYVF